MQLSIDAGTTIVQPVVAMAKEYHTFTSTLTHVRTAQSHAMALCNCDKECIHTALSDCCCS